MTTLILGGSGPIGTAIGETLRAVDTPYLSVSRTALGLSSVAADRTDTAHIQRLISDHDITTIIDVIAYTEADTLPLLATIDGKVERYVMLSSADVYRNYGLLNKTETGTPSTHLTEDAPLRTRLYPYKQSQPRADTDPKNGWMGMTKSHWKMRCGSCSQTGRSSAFHGVWRSRQAQPLRLDYDTYPERGSCHSRWCRLARMGHDL